MRVLHLFTDKSPAEKRWVNLAYILIAGSMVCGLASVAFYAVDQSRQSREREVVRAEQTEEVRYSVCVNFNIEQLGDRASALNVTLVTFGLTDSGDLTAEDRAVIVAGLDPMLQARYYQVEAQAAHDNPYRDCSPTAIKQFYEDVPVDPGVLTTIIPTTTEA